MKKHHTHLHIIVLIGVILLICLLLVGNSIYETTSKKLKPQFGVSYSPLYAKELGLDPKKTYQDILKDLKVKNIRLNAYWDEIEPAQNEYDFSQLEYYILEAQKNQANIILTVGYKLPRWPECRSPKWVDKEKSKRQEAHLSMVKAVITRFNDVSNITAFQIENEPLLNFGICPPPEKQFLQKEIKEVKAISKKPIMVTDSGELRFWKTPMELSDIFGTTLYRVVDTPWIGPMQYPLRPWFYRVKSDLIRNIFARNNQKTIISELQAESWANQPIRETPLESQLSRFSINDFKKTVEFARLTGFSEIYLWGVEWWYYMAKQGHPEYLEFAKTLF